MPKPPATFHLTIATVIFFSSLTAGSLGMVSESCADELGLKNLGKAPDFELLDPDGNAVRLSAVLEKGPVLVEFWATWCGPCRKALPRYETVYQLHRERGFTILAVSQDRASNVDKVVRFADVAALSFPVLLDPDRAVARRFSVSALPTSFLISADGTVVAKDIGYGEGDELHLDAQVQALLDATARAAPAPRGRVEGR